MPPSVTKPSKAFFSFFSDLPSIFKNLIWQSSPFLLD